MPLDEIPQLDEVDDVLDGLSSPTSLETYEAMLPYDNDMVAASATRRAMEASGGIDMVTQDEFDALTLDQVDDPVGPVSLAGQKLTGLPAPVDASDAATKAYADAVATGLDVKLSVKAATTANVTLSGTQTVDGVALIATDRVLVKNQSAGAENGIYVVAAGAWARSTDADISAEVNAGLFTFIEGGTAAADTGWVLVTNNPITLGTTALVFTQFSGAGAAAVTDATISTSDITTNNASTTKHGFLAKLDNNRSHYMGGKGEWNAQHVDTEWFVDINATAGGDGHSPAGAFTTFAAAIAAAGAHECINILSNLNEHINISKQKVHVRGVGFPVIASSSTTIADRVVTISARDVTLENVQIRGHAGFKGVLLMLDHAQEYCLRNVFIDGTVAAAAATFYPTSSAAGTGIGGIGLAIHNADGGYMEKMDIRNCSIGWAGGTWSTRADVNKMYMTQNAQDIVVGLATGAHASSAQTTAFGYGQVGTGDDAQSGSNHFTDVILVSAAGSPSYTTPPSIDLIGDNSTDSNVEVTGRNVFINLDAQENFGQARLRFGSRQNTLINFTSAAGTQVIFAGRHNHVINGYILGIEWLVTSTFNTFEDIVGGNAGMIFTGSRNTVNGAVFGSGTTVSGAGVLNTFNNVKFGVVSLTGTGNKFHNCDWLTAATLASLGTAPSVVGNEGVLPLTYGTTVAPNVQYASRLPIAVTDTVAFTISNPIDGAHETGANVFHNAPITFDILNSSGGAMGAITWGAKFALAGAFTNPASTKRRTISFYYNAVSDKWVEASRAAADI